ncbi:MAG: hypothetical protein AAF568_00630 [Pseudomonadota bacterium]
MRAILAPILVLAALALPAWAETAPGPTEPSPAAMSFVAGFSDDHLSGMLSRIGGRSEALSVLAQVHGRLTGQVFDQEIDRAVAARGPEWQRNLALAWTPLMSEAELTSLTNAGAQSPHVEKYLDLRGAAGERMQELSGDLFGEILEDVVRATYARLTPEPTGEEATE